jgi:hypothetical protein
MIFVATKSFVGYKGAAMPTAQHIARSCRLVLFAASLLPHLAIASGVGGESLTVGGFFDLLWEPDPADPARAVFRLGQAEVDIDATLSPRVGVCLAPAWNPDEESLGIGTMALNWQWSDEGLENFCRHRHVRRSGVLVGRFDVPFGIDWQVYPSLDRPLVTAPLVVQRTHGGWNSDGVMVYGARGLFNATAHATSGFPHARYRATPRPATWTPRAVYGGRLGVVPVTGWAAGVSGAWMDIVEADHAMSLTGVDLEILTGAFGLRGEAIRHRATDGARTGTTDGVYLEGRYGPGRPYGIARWDAVWDADGTVEKVLALGLGYRAQETVVLRAEYGLDLTGRGEDRLLLQLAAGI